MPPRKQPRDWFTELLASSLYKVARCDGARAAAPDSRASSVKLLTPTRSTARIPYRGITQPSQRLPYKGTKCKPTFSARNVFACESTPFCANTTETQYLSSQSRSVTSHSSCVPPSTPLGNAKRVAPPVCRLKRSPSAYLSMSPSITTQRCSGAAQALPRPSSSSSGIGVSSRRPGSTREHRREGPATRTRWGGAKWAVGTQPQSNASRGNDSGQARVGAASQKGERRECKKA